MVVSVNTKRPYKIHIEKGILKNSASYIKEVTKSRKTVIVTDDRVAELYLDTLKTSLESEGFEVYSFVFPRGEDSKSIKTLGEIYDFLVDCGITRSDFLIALGGGVVGDVTGFAAATFNRGIDFVQIPTTFLAQIDSSIGGKTAVNIAKGKNLVGSFWQPILVLCDPLTLDTLTDEIFSEGIAEAVKYGAIKSASLFDLIADDVHKNLMEIIYQSIDIKREVVEEDEEDKGNRMLLNFGHTFAHAIEKESGFKIPHGVAVAIGMCIICDLAEKEGVTPPHTSQKIKDVLAKYNLPIKTEFELSKLALICLFDKKREMSSINIILLNEIGNSYIKKMSTDDFLTFAKENR